MLEQEDLVHLVNPDLDWYLRETAKGMLTDGQVSEDLQRDRVRQIAQWLQYFPERLPQMEARTGDGREALSRARAKERRDNGTGW
jgi:DnaJ-domain-containing protein 1